jgi:hypothetical protein
LEELLPVTTRGKFDVQPVRNGLVQPALSTTEKVGTLWAQQITPRPEAQITMRMGDQPFWVQWKHGKGMVAVMTGVCYGEAERGITPFWEWNGWPAWLGAQLKALAAQTEK